MVLVSYGGTLGREYRGLSREVFCQINERWYQLGYFLLQESNMTHKIPTVRTFTMSHKNS